MIHHLPKEPGSFAELAAEVAPWDRSGAQIAQVLGVSKRTVQRWKRSNAPLAVRQLLWVLSHRGNEIMRCEKAYSAQIQRLLIESLTRKVDELNRAHHQEKHRTRPTLQESRQTSCHAS